MQDQNTQITNCDFVKIFDPAGSANDNFGFSTSISSNFLAVGSPSDGVTGSVFTYKRVGLSWVFDSIITEPSGILFGYDVALYDNFLVVGSPGSNSNQGKIFLYEYVSGSWTLQDDAVASDGVAQDYLGASVDIYNNVIVAGAPRKDSNEGKAYIYTIDSSNNIFQQAILSPSDTVRSDAFGYDVSVYQNYVAVSAPLQMINQNKMQGSVYVFENQSGPWVQIDKLFAISGENNMQFGHSIDIDDHRVYVGSVYGANKLQGNVFVFSNESSLPSDLMSSNVNFFSVYFEESTVTAFDGFPGDRFGQSVSAAGDYILIGSSCDDINMTKKQGSAYVFERVGSNYKFINKIAQDEDKKDAYGFSVSLDQTTLNAVVGVPFDDIATKSNQGSAFIYNAECVIGPEGCVNDKTLVSSSELSHQSGTDALYVGGKFRIAGQDDIKRVALWYNNQWNNIKSGVSFDGFVLAEAHAFEMYQGKIYIAGKFTRAAGKFINMVVEWDGENFNPIGSFNNTVFDLKVYDGVLYAGGRFTTINDDVFESIAFWDGLVWNNLGKTISGSFTSSESAFQTANLQFVNSTATVYAFEVHDGLLYVGGNFNTADDVLARNLATWDGSDWGLPLYNFSSSLITSESFIDSSYKPSGPNSDVFALLSYNNKLYVGGSFDQVDEFEVNHIFSLDNVISQQLGSGLDDTVRAIEVYQSTIHAGGEFISSGGIFTSNIASFDEINNLWEKVGCGIENIGVFALEVHEGKLYAGGFFEKIADEEVNNIAVWNGLFWDSLSTGTNNIVFALSSLPLLEASSQSSEICQFDIQNLLSKIRSNDGNGFDFYGKSVDVSGIHGIVGAPGKKSSQGFAYLYRSNQGNWHQVSKVNAPGAQEGDQFGFSVAIDGKFAVVGAPLADEGRGAVYTFIRVGDFWEFHRKLDACIQLGDLFGYDVAIDGDYIVVGVPEQNSPNFFGKGRVHVFKRNFLEWDEVDRFRAYDTCPGDFFGSSVDIHQKRIVVGAPGKNDRRGVAYIFSQDAPTTSPNDFIDSGDSGSSVLSSEVVLQECEPKDITRQWGEEKKLQDFDSERYDLFGHSVTIYDDKVAVGAINANKSKGQVYIYELVEILNEVNIQPSDISQLPSDSPLMLESSIPQSVCEPQFFTGEKFADSNNFGKAVSTNGTWAAIISINPNKISFFKRNGNTWKFILEALLDFSNPQKVFITQDYAVVSFERSNKVQGFWRQGDQWFRDNFLSVEKSAWGLITEEDGFGFSLSIEGDKLFVGAPYTDLGDDMGDAGALYVFNRDVDGKFWEGEEFLTLPDPKNSDFFGWSIDVQDDIIYASAPGRDSVNFASGQVFELTPSGGTWVVNQIIELNTLQEDENFGHSLSIDGNFLVVSSRMLDLSGTVYLFKKQFSGWVLKSTLNSSMPNAMFGDKVEISHLYVGISETGAFESDFNRMHVYRIVNNEILDSFDAAPDFQFSETRYAEDFSLSYNDFVFDMADDDPDPTVPKNAHLLVADPSDVAFGPFAGSVYYYKLFGDNNWQFQNKIFPNFLINDLNNYGFSVDTDGNFAVISAPQSPYNQFLNSGEVFVYELVGDQWQIFQRLMNPFPGQNHFFGKSIALKNNFLAVSSDESYGRVYIYYLESNVWTLVQIIDGNDDNVCFGGSIDLTDDWLAISDPLQENQSLEAAGLVYVYEKNINLLPSDINSSDLANNVFVSNDIWSFRQVIGSRFPHKNENFGSNIRIDPGNLVVTVPNDPYNYLTNTLVFNGGVGSFGSVYTYQLSSSSLLSSELSSELLSSLPSEGRNVILGSSVIFEPAIEYPGPWTFLQGIRELDNNQNTEDRFGQSIAVDDDWLVIGASLFEDTLPNTKNNGKVFVYHFESEMWQKVQEITSENSQGEFFGRSVDIKDGVLIVTNTEFEVIYKNMVYKYVLDNDEWVPKFKTLVSKTSSSFISNNLNNAARIGQEYFVVGSVYDLVLDNGVAVFYDLDCNFSSSSSSSFTVCTPYIIPNNEGTSFNDFGHKVDREEDFVVVSSDTNVEIRKRFFQNDWRTQQIIPSIGFKPFAVINGDYIAIGYPDANNNNGLVRIYKRFDDDIFRIVFVVEPQSDFGSGFGRFLDLSEDYLAVGTTMNPYEVYVYKRQLPIFSEESSSSLEESSSSLEESSSSPLEFEDPFVWINPVRLQPPPENIFELQSIVVDTHANGFTYIVIGVPGEIYEQEIAAGVAYVYANIESDENIWNLISTLNAYDFHENMNFGVSVDFDQEFILVGASNQNDFDNFGGAAYAFRMKDDFSWDRGSKLFNPDHDQNVAFGSDVSIDYSPMHNTYHAIVSDPERTVSGAVASGKIYLFELIGRNEWEHLVDLSHPFVTSSADRFGTSVVIDNFSVVASSPNDFVESNRGNVYIFPDCFFENLLSSSNQLPSESSPDKDFDVTFEWQEIQVLANSNGMSGDKFGFSVDLHKNFLAIGSPTDTVGLQQRRGSVSLYIFNGSEFSLQLYFNDVEEASAFDGFGQAVALDGPYLFVGAPFDDGADTIIRQPDSFSQIQETIVPAINEGALYVYFACDFPPFFIEKSSSSSAQIIFKPKQELRFFYDGQPIPTVLRFDGVCYQFRNFDIACEQESSLLSSELGCPDQLPYELIRQEDTFETCQECIGAPPLPPVPPPAPIDKVSVPFGINANGSTVTADSFTYLEDEFFLPFLKGNSEKIETDNTIGNTDNDDIYQTQRVAAGLADAFGWSIPVVNGFYDITLEFAEIEKEEIEMGEDLIEQNVVDNTGKRIINFHFKPFKDIKEDDSPGRLSPEISGIDVYDRVGHHAAEQVQYTAQVTDNVLHLFFVSASPTGTPDPTLQGAMINAIKVIRRDDFRLLYAGGNFTKTTDGKPRSFLSGWDDSTWTQIQTVGSDKGMNSDIFASIEYDQEAVFAGAFTLSAGVPTNHISSWDGYRFKTFEDGVNDNIYALEVFEDDLYVAGAFTKVDNQSFNYVARWRGHFWSPVSEVFPFDDGINAPVTALAAYNGLMYLGGQFTKVNGVDVNNIVAFDPIDNGGQWIFLNNLDSNLNPLISGDIFAMKVFQNELYIGGNFNKNDGSIADGIVKWNGSDFIDVSGGLNPINDEEIEIYAMEIFESELYVTGNFEGHIAKWDGISWMIVDGGLNSYGYTLLSSQNQLYVGGEFTIAGNVNANRVASWNGSGWSKVGEGFNASVYTLIDYSS